MGYTRGLSWPSLNRGISISNCRFQQKQHPHLPPFQLLATGLPPRSGRQAVKESLGLLATLGLERLFGMVRSPIPAATQPLTGWSGRGIAVWVTLAASLALPGPWLSALLPCSSRCKTCRHHWDDTQPRSRGLVGTRPTGRAQGHWYVIRDVRGRSGDLTSRTVTASDSCLSGHRHHIAQRLPGTSWSEG